MNRLALMTALAMTLLLGLPAGAFAQVDEPPPPPPLGDEDEPAPPPARARRAPPPRSADRAAKTQDATDEDSPVVRPSGERMLDQRAVAIVQAAAPFGKFNPAMRKQADQIVITSRFRFTREEGLETSLSTGSP